MSIKKSINIKYDLKDVSLLNGYYATRSHIDIIGYVLKGIIEGNTRSHIAYGPYGAGKSYISTILANLLSKNISDQSINDLSDKYSLIDTEIAETIKKVRLEKKKYLSITLNGYELDFQEAIYTSIKKVLIENNIEINQNGTSKIIRQIVKNWRENYPEVEEKFNSFLENYSFDSLDDFFDSFNFNEKILKEFSLFYESVSAGAKLSLYSASDFETSLLEISQQLDKKGLGLFIIYDEFGRFLQSIKENKISIFFGQMQNLAELVNKSSNISLLLVSHKPINYYFKNLSNDLRQEYSKIEKRFTSCEIKSDETTFINIALEVIKSIQTVKNRDSIDENLSRNLYKYNIFSNNFLGRLEPQDLINKSYPLHPVTLMLIPKFSQIFGQNERTLFTFLNDESKFGLKGFITKQKGFYTPDNLVDYFFSANDDKYNDNYKDVVLFKKLINQVNSVVSNEFNELSKRILKFTLIWNITNSNSVSTLSPGLIAFALNSELEHVRKAIDELSIGKLVRKNIIHKNIELIEASSADIEAEIKRIELTLRQKRNIENQTLNEYNPNKVIYSRLYNYEYDTVKFCKVYLDLNGDISDVKSSKYDLLCIISLKDDTIINENKLIYGTVSNTVELKDKLLRLASIDVLLNDKLFVSEYKNVDVDLQYEKDLVINDLSDFYNSIFTSNTRFVHNHKNFNFKNISDFEKFVDQRMYEMFNLPIIIHNDQINMYTIQKPQVSALISIMDKMIKNNSNVLKYEDNDNSAEAFAYYSIVNSNISEISNVIQNYISNNENGKVSDILKLIESEPFGIRPTLTPVVFVYSVINMWRNIMFFNNGEYIVNLPAPYLYDIGIGKYDCVYNYSDFDFRNSEYLNKIIKIFGEYSTGTDNKSIGIQALSSMYNWFLDLPVLTQIGYINDEDEKLFIKLLELSKHNPKNALVNLNRNYDINQLIYLKNKIEIIFDDYITSIDQDIRKDLGIQDWKIWASNLSDNFKRTSNFVKIALTSDRFILDYAKSFEKLDIKKWPKSMFDVLKTQIKNEYDTIVENIDTIEIIINNRVVNVADVELSTRARNLMNNIVSQVQANSKYMTKEELEKILINLFENFIK